MASRTASHTSCQTDILLAFEQGPKGCLVQPQDALFQATEVPKPLLCHREGRELGPWNTPAVCGSTLPWPKTQRRQAGAEISGFATGVVVLDRSRSKDRAGRAAHGRACYRALLPFAGIGPQEDREQTKGSPPWFRRVQAFT